MLNPHQLNGKRVYSLFELYVKLGLPPRYFFRWRNCHIHTNITITKDVDYFPRREGDTFIINHEQKVGRRHTDFFITSTLAETMCIKNGTLVAKKIKEFIQSDR